MLDVRGLCANYGRIPILSDIDFSAAKGEVVGVLGHNGMGKTTLMRTLIGLVPAVRGRIELDGEDLAPLPPHLRARRGLGYVPQGRQIFPQLSVLDNLRMGAVASRRPEAVVQSVIEDFPALKPLLDRHGGALSGGEQQILALARCLCAEPRLILLDEPTEGIQPSIIDRIEDILLRLRDERRLTIVIVEQNLDFVAALCSRVMIIQKGRILKELAPRELHHAEIMAEFVGTQATEAEEAGP
ncbi:MAG: ABC transporter ATP-binding protein [Rhodospirillaceae bacterium]|jgi:urea ABC transporter ATP-binding protein UrtE|nr:ABC transporter ATP-binding protein [Rhodospirillaceae bacterium]MDP6069916.1 ABC transporter ATP-binding protein [Alphaproteobacteria bacterium]|tara:strand:- start:148 stop:873 length:726 start_codon:yes stop_codon:yes gene_type:complete